MRTVVVTWTVVVHALCCLRKCTDYIQWWRWAINYLKRAERVRLADVRVLVPAAVRVLDAAEAAVVAPVAHGQIDLLDAMVGGDVQRFAQLANLHHLDRLVGGDLKDVQQLAERLVVAVVLDDLVDAAEIRADVVDGVLLVEQLDFDSDTCDGRKGRRCNIMDTLMANACIHIEGDGEWFNLLCSIALSDGQR